MTLSDCLTDDEWDGCYYIYLLHAKNNLSIGDVIRAVVRSLYEKGFYCKGIDINGNKLAYVPNNNDRKLKAALTGVNTYDMQHSLENGRKFIKEHLPEQLGETDDEWKTFLELAKEKK